MEHLLERGRRGLVVAIDGPAGAGKSTLARGLARELALPYVNTGLMYRALASRALAREVDPDDDRTLTEFAASMEFGLSEAGDGVRELLIEGRAPDASLTSPQVEDVVSAVARHPGVRRVLREAQRELGKEGCVMEGRDIGTVVFPDADVKIFLSASLDVRVGRRTVERDESAGAGEAVGRRDEVDARTNPFVPAADAHVLDTTMLGRDEVLAAALELVRGLEAKRDPR